MGKWKTREYERKSVLERLSSNMYHDPVTGCFLWTSDRIKLSGFADRKQRVRAIHMALYEEIMDRKAPSQHEMYRSCKNPRCWNFEHMEGPAMTDEVKEKVSEVLEDMYSKYRKVTAGERRSPEMQLYDQALIRAWDTIAALEEDGLWENVEASFKNVQKAYTRLQSMRNKQRSAVVEGVGVLV